MDPLQIASLWTTMSQSAWAHAQTMARHQHSSSAAEMIRAETRKFTDQRLPETEEELAERQSQQLALGSRIGLIAHADAMARSHPDVAADLLEETARYCDSPLPRTTEEVMRSLHEGLALGSTISRLCHGAAIRRQQGAFDGVPEFDEIVRLGREFRQAH